MGVFASTGNVLAQSSDPGSLGAGSIWSDTGNHVTYRRTDDNAQWVPIGSKVGDILFWGGTEANAPAGFAICDGSAISRTTFALLFDVIGTTFGIGDGSTTFNVPDLQTDNRFPRCASNDGAVGDTGGESTHVLTTGELAAHTHGSTGAHTHTLDNQVVTHQAGSGNKPQVTGTTDGDESSTNSAGAHTHSTVGSDTAHENKPPFLDFHYIISTGLA